MRKGIAHIQAAIVLLDVAEEEMGDAADDPENDEITGANYLLKSWWSREIEKVEE